MLSFVIHNQEPPILVLGHQNGISFLFPNIFLAELFIEKARSLNVKEACEMYDKMKQGLDTKLKTC